MINKLSLISKTILLNSVRRQILILSHHDNRILQIMRKSRAGMIEIIIMKRDKLKLDILEEIIKNR